MSSARRTALVTGANRGIGRAVCEALVRRGDIRVLAAARRSTDADETAQALGGDSLGVEFDLSDPETAERRAGEVREKCGPIDILVNNAGIMPPGRGLDGTVDEMSRALAVNAVAPLALIRAFAPGMERRRFGRIVNLSSGWGSFGESFGGPLAYSVSKAALNALTVVVADSLDPCVKVNAVCPGWVRTRMGGPDAHWSAHDAADTPVWLATLPDSGPTGGFFRRRQAIEW